MLHNTIRKGIADYKCFEEQPELLMYGCMWLYYLLDYGYF